MVLKSRDEHPIRFKCRIVYATSHRPIFLSKLSKIVMTGGCLLYFVSISFFSLSTVSDIDNI